MHAQDESAGRLRWWPSHGKAPLLSSHLRPARRSFPPRPPPHRQRCGSDDRPTRGPGVARSLQLPHRPRAAGQRRAAEGCLHPRRPSRPTDDPDRVRPAGWASACRGLGRSCTSTCTPPSMGQERVAAPRGGCVSVFSSTHRGRPPCAATDACPCGEAAVTGVAPRPHRSRGGGAGVDGRHADSQVRGGLQCGCKGRVPIHGSSRTWAATGRIDALVNSGRLALSPSHQDNLVAVGRSVRRC